MSATTQAPAATPPVAGTSGEPREGTSPDRTDARDGGARRAAAPRIVGLDLSLVSTGIADIAGTFTVKTTARGPQRLNEIRSVVRDFTRAANLVVLEGYAYNKHQGMAAIGELGGVIRLLLHTRGIRYVEIPPASLKKYACGRGNASKDDMLGAAYKRLPAFDGNNDCADAAFLRAMALDFYGFPVCDMPAVNRTALDAIAWPDLKDLA